jgi:hypothetical protein
LLLATLPARGSVRIGRSYSTAPVGLGNTLTIGTFPVSIAPPKYVAFEGVGVLDNFVVRG